MATGIIVGNVMKRGVVTATPNMTIKEVADIMIKIDIGGLPVISKGKIVGILTEGDILKDVVVKGKDYKKVKVKDVMRHPVRTISPSTDIEKAAKIMRDLNIERLPIVSRGKLVGLITERDMVQMEPALIELMQYKGASDQVAVSEKQLVVSGECEGCNAYCETLRNVEGKFLCEDCRAAGP